MFTATDKRAAVVVLGLTFLVSAVLLTRQPLAGKAKPEQRLLRIDPAPISTDKTVKYDYDIVYVRLPRKGFRAPKGKFESPIWAQAGVPLQMHPGADLMLLHPNGKEELLV